MISCMRHPESAPLALASLAVKMVRGLTWIAVAAAIRLQASTAVPPPPPPLMASKTTTVAPGETTPFAPGGSTSISATKAKGIFAFLPSQEQIKAASRLNDIIADGKDPQKHVEELKPLLEYAKSVPPDVIRTIMKLYFSEQTMAEIKKWGILDDPKKMEEAMEMAGVKPETPKNGKNHLSTEEP